MPTPTGLPKKGDRVVWEPKIFGQPKVQPMSGTVLGRGTGKFWSLTVKYDNGKKICNVDAAHYWNIGWLKLEENK